MAAPTVVALAACVPAPLTYDPGPTKGKDPQHVPDATSEHEASAPSSGGAHVGDGGRESAASSGGAPNDSGRDGMRVDADAHADARADADADAAPVCPATPYGPRLIPVLSLPLVAMGAPLVRYCMDETEVTVADYAAFLTDARLRMPAQIQICSWNHDFTPFDDPDGLAGDAPNDPVVGVDWCDAYAYCAWAGKHLCGRIGGGSNPFDDFEREDTSEWYNACSNKGANRYPYGSVYDQRRCAGADSAGAMVPVATSSGCTNEDGVFDLSGNVWEWEDSCATTTGSFDQCRVRGGSYKADSGFLTCGADSTAYSDFRRSAVDGAVGFRCCGANYLPQ